MGSISAQRITGELNTIERVQVEWFFSQFTQVYYKEYLIGHIIQLAYAAVPAYLTPDLLYKMRQNFGRYTWGEREEYVHPLAVSDILLAPFCREISHELFRMNENVRLALLKWMNSSDPLWLKCNPATIEEIARFVKRYHESPNEATIRHGQQYREEQDFEARFYFDSAEVAREYLNKLHEAKDNRDVLMAINALLKAKAREEALSTELRHFSNLFTNQELELWKNALQQNVNSLTDLVGKEAHNVEIKKLFALTSKNARATKVTINRQETKAARQMDAMMPAKKKAIYIGLSTADSRNCELMSKTIQDSHPDPWENHFLTKPMSNRELDTRLNDIIAGCTRYDHLLVYISIADAKGPSVSKNKMVGIIPKAHTLIESVFQKSTAGGLTVIYDGMLEQAPKINHLLTDGKVVFVSPQGSQPDKKSKKAASEFTSMLSEAITRHSSLPTNRQLYAAILVAYNNHNTSPNNNEPRVNSPMLMCNRDTCGFPFTRNLSTRDSAQNGLRLLGYTHTSAHTDWTGDDEFALVQFASENRMAPDVNALLPAITTELNQVQQDVRPLFLFVFSDPNYQLTSIENEIKLLQEILKETLFSSLVETKIMHNRSLADIDQFIRHVDNRNRLQLFYYSGMDQNGNAVFTDGELTIDRWAAWLSFHSRLEWVVFNTCRAALLAEQLTQLGVSMTMGAFGEISDRYGGYFADLLFKAIAFRQSVDTLPFSSIDQRK